MIQISHETDVLLLDDDTHLRTALSQTFDLAGLRVQACGSAEGIAQAVPAQWSGVVCDQGRDAVADDLARLLGIDHLCTEYLDGLAELAGHVSAAVAWLTYVNKRLVARCSSRFFVGGVLYAVGCCQ